jgi:hypothetical protein
MNHNEETAARIRILEKQVAFLLKINGLDLSALRNAPDQELLEWYRNAVTSLGLSKPFPPEMISPWTEFFLQVSELEFRRLAGLVDYHHTWEPFYQICVKFMTDVRQHKDFGTDHHLNQLYALLDKGRRNLREAAVMILTDHPEGLPDRTKALLRCDRLLSALSK